MRRLLPSLTRHGIAPATLILLAGCAATPAPADVDAHLESLALASAAPTTLLPRTPLDLLGAGFVPSSSGLSFVRLVGTFSDGSSSRDVDVELPATYVSGVQLRVAADAGTWRALVADAATAGGSSQAIGRFDGMARVAIDSAVDHARHLTAPVGVAFTLARTLAPTLASVDGGGQKGVALNQGLAVVGANLLLGGDEGRTLAILDGCFLPSTKQGLCEAVGTPVRAVAVPIAPEPDAPWDRTRARLPVETGIAGIHPGTFSGTVTLRNEAAPLPSTKPPAPLDSSSVSLGYTVRKSTIDGFTPPAGSLGRIVGVRGAGFIGTPPGATVGGGATPEVTILHLVGNFTPEGAKQPLPVDLELLPRYLAGDQLAYTLDEDDELGHAIDLRQIAGRFVGTAQPLLRAGPDEEDGIASPVTLALEHVKQVVWLRFLPSYVSALASYGLAAADAAVRARVVAVAVRDYTGVNVEWRTTEPNDYALYSIVDVTGPDPNGLGLFGYDNTPGKDVGNARLFDHIGGVNATTQADGAPGYGGVFVDNFLAFSQHPPRSVAPLPETAPLFDQLFDPLRPDTGAPATVDEVASAPAFEDGSACPADPSDRPTVVGCAIFALGGLIGSTVTHETGHSLGLADPMDMYCMAPPCYHDVGDLPNRLMESGGARPFAERVEMGGQGPGRFCDEEYRYLQAVLPAPGVKDPFAGTRPDCRAH